MLNSEFPLFYKSIIRIIDNIDFSVESDGTLSDIFYQPLFYNNFVSDDWCTVVPVDRFCKAKMTVVGDIIDFKNRCYISHDMFSHKLEILSKRIASSL